MKKFNEKETKIILENVLKITKVIDPTFDIITESDQNKFNNILKYDYGLLLKNDILIEAEEGEAATGIFGKIINMFKNLITGAVSIVKSVITGIFSFVKSYWKIILTAGLSITALFAAGGQVASLVSLVKNLMTTAKGIMTGGGKSIVSKLATTATKLAQLIFKWFNGGLKRAIGLVNKNGTTDVGVFKNLVGGGVKKFIDLIVKIVQFIANGWIKFYTSPDNADKVTSLTQLSTMLIPAQYQQAYMMMQTVSFTAQTWVPGAAEVVALSKHKLTSWLTGKQQMVNQKLAKAKATSQSTEEPTAPAPAPAPQSNAKAGLNGLPQPTNNVPK